MSERGFLQQALRIRLERLEDESAIRWLMAEMMQKAD